VVFILRIDSTIPEREKGGTKYAGDVVTKAVGAVRWVKRAIRKHAKMLLLLGVIGKLGRLDW
jgi:hypothetical protein